APILLNLFNRGIDFFFLLVMLRLLSPESVGVYYYLVVIFGWFDIFSNFGLDLYLIREVSREKKRAGHYFYNTAILRLAVSIAGIALLTAFILVRQATIDPALSSEALLTLGLLYLGLFPGSLNKGMTSLFYAFEQAEKPAAIATITSVNKAIFGVIVLLAGYGIVGLAGVSIINNIITFVVLLYSGRALIGKISQWRPDMKLIQVMLREGFPLLLNHFLQTIFFKIDIIVLEAMKGAGVVARYSIAYKWIEAINIIPAFFTQALLPIMSRQAQEDKHALLQTYRFGIKFLFAFSVPIAVGFTFMAEPLTFLMGGQQYLPDSAIAIQLMIWSIPIGWMNSLTQYALIALDLQRSITRAFFAAVGFNIIVNIIFIPQYGFQAAAIATIFSEMVLLVPFGILMHRGLEQPIGWMSLLWRPVIAATGMMAVTLLLTPVQVILALIVGSGVYLMIFFGLRPLEQHEIAILETILPGRITQFLL
ncbi:MAG: flippase, partial [Aggregatilineales bacterium]